MQPAMQQQEMQNRMAENPPRYYDAQGQPHYAGDPISIAPQGTPGSATLSAYEHGLQLQHMLPEQRSGNAFSAGDGGTGVGDAGGYAQGHGISSSYSGANVLPFTQPGRPLNASRSRGFRQASPGGGGLHDTTPGGSATTRARI